MIAVQDLLFALFRTGLPVIGCASAGLYAMRKDKGTAKSLGYAFGGWFVGYGAGALILKLLDAKGDNLPDQVGALGSPPATREAYDPSSPTRRPDAPPVGAPPAGPQPPQGTSQVIGASGEVLATDGPPAVLEKHPKSARVQGTLFADAYGQGGM